MRVVKRVFYSSVFTALKMPWGLWSCWFIFLVVSFLMSFQSREKVLHSQGA